MSFSEQKSQLLQISDFEMHLRRIETSVSASPVPGLQTKARWFCQSSHHTNYRYKKLVFPTTGIKTVHLQSGRETDQS